MSAISGPFGSGGNFYTNNKPCSNPTVIQGHLNGKDIQGSGHDTVQFTSSFLDSHLNFDKTNHDVTLKVDGKDPLETIKGVDEIDFNDGRATWDPTGGPDGKGIWTFQEGGKNAHGQFIAPNQPDSIAH